MVAVPTPIGPSYFVVRDYTCPECGAARGVPCLGTRYTDEGHHAARIEAATGTAMLAPPRRFYDRTWDEQHAVPEGHEDGDPRADEVATVVTFTEAQRQRGLANLAVARALMAEHRASHD